MQQLKHKIAVVTGGSSGIGLGIAKRFAAEGAKVVITGRSKTTLDEAVAQIGHGALAIQGDISKVKDLDRIFGTVNEKLGRIDILVANAGSYILGPLAEFTEDMFDRLSDINFKGTFFTVQKALPLLKEGASVMLVSSTVNGKGVPNHAAYSATKAAIRSLARSFSAELLNR